MIRPIAFCAGLALAWCGTARAVDLECTGTAASCMEYFKQAKKMISTPDDAAKIEINDLKARVKALEQISKELCAELAMPCPETRQ